MNKLLVATLLWVLLTVNFAPEIAVSSGLNQSKPKKRESTPKVEKVPEKAPKWDNLSTAEKVKLNPNNCDLGGSEVMWGDGSCHPTSPSVSKTTSTAPATITGSGDCASEIQKYDWPVSTAHAVMMQESGNRPSAHNYNPNTGDDSWGCFQINLYGANAASRPSPSWLVVAANNVSYAYNMYKSMGTFCTPGGWYNI